jgi:hypothetical protein
LDFGGFKTLIVMRFDMWPFEKSLPLLASHNSPPSSKNQYFQSYGL